MFLCFGTAILSLAVHWYNMKTTAQINPSVSTTLRKNPPASKNNPTDGISVSVGATALGADFTPSSSNLSNSNTGKKYVASAADTPKKTNNKPQGFFFPRAAEAKSLQGLGSAQTQVVVDLSDRRTYVYRYDQVIASYPIAIGKKGWETPTGSFQVIHKEHHPIWKHPITGEIFEAGTDSPLGDRWIGFWSDGRNEIGFHGTPNTDLIGAAVSHGCLRMRNPDVRMLYEQVDLGTPVLVRD
jgi:lipoprotein-anchoring transpeptidase ErfK/SrfK